jgi:hypothetical protein
MDWQNLLVSALIQSLMGTLIYFAIRRPREEVAELRKEVTDLKDTRVTALENKVAAAEEYGRGRREKIYESLQDLKDGKVDVSNCKDLHKELMAGLQEYRCAVVDLKGVQVELKSTAAFVSDVNERVIGLAADVSRMEGEIHGPR